MKIRNGFVSNSSSSSFIIGVKGELTAEKLMEVTGIKKDNPIYGILLYETERLLQYINKLENEDNWYCDTELKEAYKLIKKKKMTIYVGSIPGYGEGGNELENAIAETKISYRSKDLIVEKGDSW